jgi:uncharacterized membrane protein YraQ (UPF0718 family)
MEAKSTFTMTHFVSSLLGILGFAFGVTCMCAVPLYIYFYESEAGSVAEISAMLAGIILGAAAIYSSTALFRIGRKHEASPPEQI